MAKKKLPPHDKKAEQSVLGAILIDPEAIALVAEFLRPKHFYEPRLGKIFDACLSLFEKHKPVDLITVSSELKKMKTLEEIGGAGFLSELLEIVPTAANVEHYGKIILEEFTKRQLISASSKIAERAFSEDEAKEVLDRAEAEIFSISQTHLRRDFTPVKDALAESFDRLDELHDKAEGLRGLPTGFVDLDSRLAGMQASNLLVLAARPGMGKTAFALNVAQFLAVQKKVPVGFFSLEMSKEELVDRLLVAQADVDAWKLKTGRLSEKDFTSLSEAMGILSEAPLFIDDTPGLNILEMRTKARRLQMEKKARLFILDYLQLADSGRRFDNRVQEVSLISQALKNLARELRVPVLAVSQLSRAVEVRGGKKPQLADLRESGAIEQDADVVMFLYREEDPKKWGGDILTKLLIAKHRNGPLAELEMIFKSNRIRFYGVEKKRKKKD